VTATAFDRSRSVVEGGWVLEGTSGEGKPIKLVFGETELEHAYLGLTIGRHPALCDRLIADPGVSRRHLRIGVEGGSLFVEDLHSLNGTALDGEPVAPFQPTPLAVGQELILGRVVLTVSRL
jgi:pilus assembly protein CpaF